MSWPLKVSIIIFVLAVLSVGGVTAFRTLSKTVDQTDYFAQGNTYFEKTDYSKALASYQKALESKNNIEIYQKIAKIYENKGRISDSIDILTTSLTKSSNLNEELKADIQYDIAELSVQLIPTDNKYVDQAINNYLDSSKSEKHKLNGNYNAARLMSMKATKEDMDKAKEIYISLNNYAPAKYELMMYELENMDKISLALVEAQKLPATPEDDSLLKIFPTWLEFGKQAKEQINAVSSDIANKKTNATILDSKGYLAYKLDRCEFGLQSFKDAVTEGEKEAFYPQARILLGECLKRLNKYDEAKAYLEPVLEKQPDNVQARLVLRQVYKGLGDKEKMKKIYDELITLDGQNISLRLDYARDNDFIEEWRGAANQYEWLFNNVNSSEIIDNKKNSDFIFNKDYMLRAYQIYAYKLKDYQKAQDIITNAKAYSAKKAEDGGRNLIDATTADELISWTNYMLNESNKDLENDVLAKATNLETSDAYYHKAYIAYKNKQNDIAKDSALKAYDLDTNGYLSALAAEIVNQIDK